MTTDHTLTAPVVLEDVDTVVGLVAVIAGPDRGIEQPFTGQRLIVGSGERAGLMLSDRTVSKLHCELRREGNAVRLRDLGSKNGVFVGGCRIADALLPAGAQLQLGSTTLSVEVARRRTRVPVWRGPDHFGALLGASSAMHELFAMLERIASTQMSALIRGESGTGKELVARALHDASPRAGGPFVVVDGAALTHSIADLELFGHVRGAFTDADVDREGAFERAHGGTVFLDEVAELPPETQAKLLRVVQEGTVKRLGDAIVRPVDVRIIAATHRDLEKRINEGSFREDLYYRLATVVVEVPPLRERAGDIPLLARALAADFAKSEPRALALVDRAIAQHAGYLWPGNVRELRSFVRRALVLGDPSLGLPSGMASGPPRIRTDLPFAEARKEWVQSFERQYLRWVLDECSGNVTEAAHRAALARSSFYELMTKLGL